MHSGKDIKCDELRTERTGERVTGKQAGRFSEEMKQLIM